VVASHLNVRTNDIANKAVTTKKLANGAVTPKKIKNNAVKAPKIAGGAVTNAKVAGGAITTPKIADRAITSAKLERYVPGVAVAGLSKEAGSSVTVQNWFNRFGGQPTIERGAAGFYIVTIPGLEGRLGTAAITSVTVNAAVGAGRQHAHVNKDVIMVATFDADGTNTDLGFDLVVHAPSE
ncbi:hypothetical protein, partial [Nocardioides sp.]|uniref:hypothetical protein n=1 Tax=Nocardioides sp. TaxID=35761 RepID=UPI002732558E